jgi:hypothetical protein
VTDNDLDQSLLEAFDARVPSPERLRELLPAPEAQRRSSLWLGLVAAAVLLVVAVPSLSPRGSPGAPSLPAPSVPAPSVPAPSALLPPPEGMRIVTVSVDPEHVAADRLVPGDVVDLYVIRQDLLAAQVTGTVVGTMPEGRLTVSLPAEQAQRLVESADTEGTVWPAEHDIALRLVMVAPQPLRRPRSEGERVIVMGSSGRLGQDLLAQEPRERSFRVLVPPDVAAQIAQASTTGHRVLITSER